MYTPGGDGVVRQRPKSAQVHIVEYDPAAVAPRPIVVESPRLV